MNLEKRTSRQDNNLLLGLIIMTGVTIFSDTLFEVYTDYSLYVISVFVMLFLLLNKVISGRLLLFLSIFTIYLFCSLLYNGGGIGSIVTVALFFLLLYCFTKLKIIRISKNPVVIFSIAMIFYLFIRSFAYGQDFDYYRNNSINPNSMGMFLIYCCMLLFSVLNFRNSVNKLFAVGVVAMAFVALGNYSARGSMLSLLFFLILNVIFSRRVSKRVLLVVVIVIIVVGLAFPFVYLSLYRNDVNFELFGKSLYTGREVIWDSMLDELNQNYMNWLFGLGSKAELWEGHSLNVHNNYFAVLVNFGIVGFVLYYGFLFTMIAKTASIIDEFACAKKLLFMFISGSLLLGFFEVTTLWIPIYPFVCFSLGGAYSFYHNKCTVPVGKERI